MTRIPTGKIITVPLWQLEHLFHLGEGARYDLLCSARTAGLGGHVCRILDYDSVGRERNRRARYTLEMSGGRRISCWGPDARKLEACAREPTEDELAYFALGVAVA